MSGADYTYIAYIGLSGVSIAAALYLLRLGRRRKASTRVVVEMKCLSCGSVMYKNFEEGDFVGRIYPAYCKRCGGDMVIDAIYEEESESVQSRLFVVRKSIVKPRPSGASIKSKK